MNNHDFYKSSVTVVTEEEAESLARKFQEEIDAHSSSNDWSGKIYVSTVEPFNH